MLSLRIAERTGLPFISGYLLGIKCDGASYHSGRSARDRDRLRQEILENLGWKIHRVWSTDWFRNRDNEVKRLLLRIDELLQADPVYQREKEKVSRIDTLRQRLIALREVEIKPAFPETPAEQGLLRKVSSKSSSRSVPSPKQIGFASFRKATAQVSIRSKLADTLTRCCN